MTIYNVPESLPQPAQCYPFKPGEAVYYLPYPAGFCNQQQLIPAIVLAAPSKLITPNMPRRHHPRISILRQDGKRTTVRADKLAYQGHCAFCGVPAVLDRDALTCPQCRAPATATPPPDELTLRLFPIDCAGSSKLARICALTGCTWGDALEQRNKSSRQAFDALVRKHGMLGEMYRRESAWTEENGQWYWFNDAMEWFAELGDEESFLAYYRAHAPNGLLPAERTERIVTFFKVLFDRLEDDDGPGHASQRLVLPPLAIERAADDSEPDGADDVTRWLEQQFKRAA